MESLKLNLGEKYRVFVISDVHGNYPLFKELVDKLDLKDEDYLILLGDLINRYPYSFECLSFAMELSKRDRTFACLGNHEYCLYDLIVNFENLTEDQIYSYTRGTKLRSVFEYWSNEVNLKVDTIEDLEKSLKSVRRLSKQEMNYIENMYKYIETEDFVFVHSGLKKGLSLEEQSIHELTESFAFFKEGHDLDKIAVVGHWPTKAIPEDKVSSDVKYFLDKKMIFIDGGNSMDMDRVTYMDLYGQLNALVIEKENSVISYSSIVAELEDSYTVTKDVTKIYKDDFILNHGNFKISIDEYDEDFYLSHAVNKDTRGLLLKEFYKLYPYPTTYAGKLLEPKKGDTVNLRRSFKNYSMVKYKSEFGLVANKYLEKS